MMALQQQQQQQQPPPLANDRKRVKVYELRDNDWFDRGTGFCTGQVVENEPRIYVESEDEPDKMLLEAKIVKDDGYQKQQDTLIVWTDTNGVDMALSFQEAEGCAVIWDFVHQVQQQLMSMQGQDVLVHMSADLLRCADDGLSDDGIDGISSSFALSSPELGNLDEVEQMIRQASMSAGGRDALAKFLIRDEYLHKLIPLVEMAEDLESLPDLHRLCNIMKALILMNDNGVIEHIVTDEIIIGAVGALEYDPDFPTHKANHRQYLSDQSKYKEVVEIKDPIIRRKIRQTWRLQYLKDVVLARILDDPTFNVLNSLIFFNQVEIVQHLQNNPPFLKELFSIFNHDDEAMERKEQAVHFLQQCTAIAKTLQIQQRAQLLSSLISHGLLAVITFAVKHPNPAMRTTGIDILVALLDYDPNMMKGYMLKAVHDKKVPLTDTLIDLLHVETDLGVKNHLTDAIKVLLDPQPPNNDHMGNRPGAEYMTKLSRPQLTPTQAANEQFAQDHFDRSSRKLFRPIYDLKTRQSMSDMSYQEVSLFGHLVEILTFFVRSHPARSRPFVAQLELVSRVAQLLRVLQKPLKLTALKFFRQCVTLQEPFYQKQIIESPAFEGILSLVIETMPRDNLLNSACLELFEFVKKEAIKPIILHLGNNFANKLQDITYVDTFSNLLLRFEQLTTDSGDSELILFSQDEDSPNMNRAQANGRWQGLPDMDVNEEDYFNTSDDDDEENRSAENDVMDRMQWQKRRSRSDVINGGASPATKPLVSYAEDDDDDDDDEGRTDIRTTTPTQTPLTPESEKENSSPELRTRRLQPSPNIRSLVDSDVQPPAERLVEKRRRQEDEDEDELGKLSTSGKRRNSTASGSSLASNSSLRRRKGFVRSKHGGEAGSPASPNTPSSGDDTKPRTKIAISLQTLNRSAEGAGKVKHHDHVKSKQK